MKTIKVVDNMIYVEHNGVVARYSIYSSHCRGFQQELIDFQNLFFDNGEVSWSDIELPSDCTDSFNFIHVLDTTERTLMEI